MPLPKADKIRELNDNFRTDEDATIPGKIVMTSGLLMLIEEHGKTNDEVVMIVRKFDVFTEDNDPHCEHDFGAFEFCSAKIFWKFDYYDPDIMYGSEDPANAEKTYRILTIFLASEY